MKTSAAYRSLAWNELRSQFSLSGIIICSAIIISLVAFAVFFLPTIAIPEQSLLTNYLILLALIVISLSTVGLLYYYLPTCFLTMVRTKQVSGESVKILYGRSLATVWLMFFPSLIIFFLSAMEKHTDESNAIILLIPYLAAYIFFFWWAYAVTHTLPFIIHDHKELSLWQATKQSIAMMKGHKWELFKVDMRIVLLPLLLLFVMATVIGVLFVMIERGNEVSTGLLVSTIAFGVIILLLVFFIIVPMEYFAHAHFYEDLREENNV